MSLLRTKGPSKNVSNERLEVIERKKGKQTDQPTDEVTGGARQREDQPAEDELKSKWMLRKTFQGHLRKS
jgi:hypothetical protein